MDDIRKHSGSKYIRSIPSCLPPDTANPDEPRYVHGDVYSVLEAFQVVNPGIQHAVKKLLCAGIRGKVTMTQDIQEAIDALYRAKQIAETGGG